MKMSRVWAMSNKNTFDIKPVRFFVNNYTRQGTTIVDPFANKSKIGTITNDLDDDYDTDYNMDALEFLKILDGNIADCILFDPPYSKRQLVEVYKKMDLSVTRETTQSDYWTYIKKEFNRILKPGGFILSFGWNSNGLGLSNMCEIIEIMLVAHGGSKNDTICMCEQKINNGELF